MGFLRTLMTYLSQLPFLEGGGLVHQESPPAQGGEDGSVRLLLTKNPFCPLVAACKEAVSRLNGSC